MAEQEELITEFATIAGIERDRARFHLESAAWDLQIALANFYEGPWEEEVGTPTDPMDMGPLTEAIHREEDTTAPPETTHHVEPSNQNRLGTIATLPRSPSPSSDEEGQAYYAGGSERSGQEVLGPGKKKKVPANFVKNLFQAAREHGAEELEPSDQPGETSQRLAFYGTGYRLGESSGSFEVVPGSSTDSSVPQVDIITLKMWKRGFSIDAGELRLYNDQNNAEFLDSIRMGRVPEELIHRANGSVVNLNMEDHRTEDFVKPKVKAFSGAGNVLGSPVPTMSRSVPPEARVSEALKQFKVPTDPSKPVTTVQIRLSDGKRMAAKFNTSHTVRDIRNYIVACPQYASAAFILMTTFPRQELTDENQTLEEANLCNAVVMQHLT